MVCFAALGFALVSLVAGTPHEEPSWWSAAARAVSALEREDVTAVAAEVEHAAATRDAGELLYRLEILVRAGHDAGARAAIDALAAADPPLAAHVAGEFVDALIGRRERALALRALGCLPRAEPGWGYVLLGDWADEVGWERVDRWAAERQASAPTYWLGLRLDLRGRHGTARELFAELEADARAHPDDLERFLRLHELHQRVQPAPDLEWLAQVFRPRNAFEAARLAIEVRGPCAAGLLERALEMQLAPADIAEMRAWLLRRSSMPWFPRDDEAWRSWLRSSMRQALVQAYLDADRAADAQALLEALANETPSSDGLPAVSLFLAGVVQAGSGARAFENAVLQGAEERRDSPEYWTGRADYYAGRGERREELDALDEALALVPAGDEARRSLLILRKADRLGEPEGGALLLAQAARLPAESEAGGRLLYALAIDHAAALRADEPVAWRRLDATASWGHVEERLLRVMAGTLDDAQLPTFWAQAEKLAAAQAPLRTPTLAWVAHRRGDARRAVQQLAPVLDAVPQGDSREAAAVTLFEASRDAGVWDTAERAWPLARRRLTPSETAPWLAGLAVAQAQAGNLDAALRTWSRVANLDRRELGALDALVAAGLRERLVAFYRDIAQRDPAAAEFVARVLVRLGA